jgi:hypothetical protein
LRKLAIKSSGFLPGGAIGNLFAKLVPLAKLLPDNLDNIFGVGVILGKNQRLRYFRPCQGKSRSIACF